MASAIGTLRRPMEMMSRGQGASSFSLEATERSSRAGGNKDLQRRRNESHRARSRAPASG